ncbi:flavodoxin family protein [Amycolatopsis suaedae]|uniref:Flavodoxin n=1 Tax=Amycolatopsis suaedae TaxID=2510978 RepID=A0A4Q7JF14_9PSEU|nr:NAD(P)H-dependent oxidoreductase [Amycolatopsis suaedae]RZQ65363.1 flavodoxin [Amycolatopsis suaedae]
MSERKFLFVLGSARRDGNTEKLAREAALQLPNDVRQEWLHLDDLPLPPFADIRHAGLDYPEPEGNAKVLLDATLSATDLVIASPVYWYSVSATTKLYLDHWTAWMERDDIDFKRHMAGKTLWGVSVLAEPRKMADPLVGVLRQTASYLHMRWGGMLVGIGSRPGRVEADTEVMTQAKTFFAA